MKAPSSSSLLVALSLSGLAAGAVHKTLAATPQGWKANAAVASDQGQDQTAIFTLALHRDFSDLENHVLGVSTPGHANYGKYLDVGDVESLFSPASGAASAVTAWLEQNGISDYQIDGSFVDFTATLETANSVLNASYQHYTSTDQDTTTKLRTSHYTIPDEVENYIAFVDPGTFFGSTQKFRVPSHLKNPSRPTPAKRAASSTVVDASCATSITPSCLKQLYNVQDYQPDANSGSHIGFGSFLNESALYADLEQFEELFGIPSQNVTKVLVANGINDQNSSNGNYGEANLDVQTIVGVAHPLPVTEFITGGSPPFIPTYGQPTAANNSNEPYVPFLRYLLSKTNAELPQVISMSYGDQEDGVPYDYAVYSCSLIGLLGLRGISVLSSSGDGGLGGACLGTDFKTVEFGRVFPASCPFITAVGGTSASSVPEVAWDQSSGGFSGYFPRAWYQENAVQGYLQNRISRETYEYYGQYTHFGGRAYPDVAAHSLNPDFEIINAGKQSASGGTSAASPTFAAIVGLLNDARFRAGKPSLGFLNPLIYALNGRGFFDVVDGYTYGCLGKKAGEGVVPGARWNATAGWDPITGFGTPDFQTLKGYVLNL
ncbi:tripeptidyl peptidase a [Grosmannia clavigera kw1407]|uniref:tripeptidyl-peptidase II n=1 Tax=Grosmannia clavigera (strain kw1407 / UAMH 11150) TaxID=655863 RepID=F0X7A9_GROCL|nr:tripeptidyl peptidase a [Grosmannia clavigera kw1407]EFX06546.1 tripeptidyl peptidase a [Grosmannia clavigera kw1407]